MQALKSLEQIAQNSALPDRNQAHLEVTRILQDLAGREPARKTAFERATPLTYEQIQVRIERLSWKVWLAWALLTAIAGTAFLILNNPGFGTLLDFETALFWRIGVPSVLQNLTSDSVTTALGLQVVRP